MGVTEDAREKEVSFRPSDLNQKFLKLIKSLKQKFRCSERALSTILRKSNGMVVWGYGRRPKKRRIFPTFGSSLIGTGAEYYFEKIDVFLVSVRCGF